MKKWEILAKLSTKTRSEDIIKLLLDNRGLKTQKEINIFLNPPDPENLLVQEVEIDKGQLQKTIERLKKAVKDRESVVVYADYDADGITAGAIMWETLFKLGVKAMPYIPHRVDEGYGLSIKGIDYVNEAYRPTLIVTVDHGITAYKKVEYAKKRGIEVIVTDHHVKPKKLPQSLIVHTIKLSGAGISWFVAKELLRSTHTDNSPDWKKELVALAAIGTIADLVPLVGPNRSIAKYGLEVAGRTLRVGLKALINDAGLSGKNLGTYDVSHIIAPRLNAMGRIEHALDALRLLCTTNVTKAQELAKKLGLTNKERQQLTLETTMHAMTLLPESPKKLIFVSHSQYNQGVIGLVAGKIVEEYYRPAIVVAKGEIYSKASARSISGFNIVEAVRSVSDLLVDVGGHPMAAGFTVETKNLTLLQSRLEELAEKELTPEILTKSIKIDTEIPLSAVSADLWKKIRQFEPFGFGNTEPVFATKKVKILDVRLVGAENKHLKLLVSDGENQFRAIAFGLGKLFGKLKPDLPVDIAYTIDLDTWNGAKRLQLKIRDMNVI